MTPIRAVIFDCDGVMFDSREANRAFYNAVLAHFARPPLTEEQMAFAHQSTAGEALEMLFGRGRDLEAARAYCRELTYFPFIPLMLPEPHLKGLLSRIRPAFATGISTNRTDTMPHVLAHHGLEGLFGCVVTALDVPRPKPHPDCLVKAASLLGFDVGEAVYVGDSPVDEQAAAAAEMPFAAFGNPALKAAWHLTRLDQVEDILAEHGLPAVA
ncbi:MAG: HAD family phosphatase [Proteobacteria bacterium]|nr:HAD family phosphatase [Pseudomonadota bacterium]